MKKFFEEFKEFINKGNVMNLAVGIIIGSAFTAIVTSLVDDIISPVIGTLFKMDFSDLAITVGDARIAYGSFIMAILNFLIIAFVIFLLVKAVNKAMTVGRKKEEEAPTTKTCPYCKSEIDIEATRCPHCTSELHE